MESFGIYSLKAGLILVLFWGIYLLFLQRETFYRFNRAFLLTGLIASVVFPLIIIRYTVVVVSAPTILMYSIDELATMPATVDKFTFSVICNQMLSIVYGGVLIVLLIGRSIGLARIFKSIRRNNHQRIAGYRIIESSDFNGAFSFFRFVFIPLHLNEAEKKIILKHEDTHIRQKHWIDLLLTNILRLIWWFNPVVRLYEKAVRNNHEYLADKESFIDSKQINYQQVLLNQWFKAPVFPITNSFSYTNSLKRIVMMKKNISNPFKKLYALLVIPALVLILSAFAEKVYVKQDPIVENETEIKPKSQTNSLHFSDKPLILVDGVEVSNIENLSSEEIDSFSMLKDRNSTTAIYGEKAKDSVILITTKANKTQETDEVHQRLIRIVQQDSVIKSLIVDLAQQTEQQQAELIAKVAHLEKQLSELHKEQAGLKAPKTELQKEQTEGFEKIPEGFEKIPIEKIQELPLWLMETNQIGKEHIILVDGNKVSSLQNINMNDIDSMSIIQKTRTTTQGQRVYPKWSEEVLDGAIIITTKRKAPNQQTED